MKLDHGRQVETDNSISVSGGDSSGLSRTPAEVSLVARLENCASDAYISMMKARFGSQEYQDFRLQYENAKYLADLQRQKGYGHKEWER